MRILESVPAGCVPLGKAPGSHGRVSVVDNFLLAGFFTLQRLPKPFTSFQAIVHLRSRFSWDRPNAKYIWERLYRLGWVGQTGSKSKGKALWQTRKIDCTIYLQEAERLLLEGESSVKKSK